MWRYIRKLFCKEIIIPEIYHTQKILDRYGDYVECGTWGVMNIETGESEIKGKMMSETIKFVGEDGRIKLGSDWVMEPVQQ